MALLFAALACDRHVEPYVPGEEPRAPDLARIFPERVVAERSGTSAGSPSAAGSVAGTITLAPELASQVPPGAVLFLVARRPDGGPPVAVRRFTRLRFPLAFELGPEHRMIEAVPFAGPLLLSARIDADGNAMTRSPGDLEGQVPDPVEPGDTGITLEIEQRL